MRIRLSRQVVCPECGSGDLVCVHRRMWMRIIPCTRCYRCEACASRFLSVGGRLAFSFPF